MREDAPRFFVMLSSVSSVFGGAGRSDCAAANMVQDVYTYVRRRRRADQHTLALSCRVWPRISRIWKNHFPS
ncbi:MAG: KR domain-containing protein [Clostridia bacterium]